MESELYHHGIKGQKWGIRRFQPYPKGEKPKGGKEIGEARRVKRKDKSYKKVEKSVDKASRKVADVVSKKEEKNQAKAIKREEADVKKEQAKIDAQQKPIKKKLSEMTEEELQSEIRRLQLEKQYADLFKAMNPQPVPAKKGKGAVNRILGQIAENAVKDVGTQVMKYALGSMVNKASGKKIVKVGDNDKKKEKKDDGN